jgi:hypothetical protein
MNRREPVLAGVPAMRQTGNGGAAVRAAPRVFGGLLAFGLLWGCGAGEASLPDDKGPPPVTVEVMTLEPELLRNVVQIPGQLEAEYSIALRPEIEGVIASIGFVEGQQVTEGDVLFRLRDEEQRARVREAQAQLALASDEHRRTQELARRSVSSAAQLDRAAAEREVARARVELARVELDSMPSTGSSSCSRCPRWPWAACARELLWSLQWLPFPARPSPGRCSSFPRPSIPRDAESC